VNDAASVVGNSLRTARGSIFRLLPRRSDYANVRRSWKQDVVAGVTVGVVALPLALAFGIASGLGAQAGLITAIVAGFIAAVFGGSNVAVSGPTGAMAVVLVPIVAAHGPGIVVVVGAFAGALIIIGALCRVGRLLAFVPWPVIEGFTVGIAVIIFLQQVPNALGVAKPDGTNNGVVAGRAIWAALHGGGAAGALVVLLVVVALMLVLPRLHRALPASLLAVLVATTIAEVFGLKIARIGSLPSSLPLPTLPHLPSADLAGVFGPALAIALLAAIESLLSAKVADGMSDGEGYDPDRELFGQGLANIGASVFGGMPATGAIARTAVNVRAGGRTRVSAIVHSIVLLLVVFLAGGLVARIPLAALAGVLMVTAMRMIEPHNVRAVVRATRGDAFVLAITAFVTIAFDLILAVEIGVAIAGLFALVSVARSARFDLEPIEPEVDVNFEHDLLHQHIAVYRIDGAMFFGAAQRFLTELTAVSDIEVAIIRCRGIHMIDATGANALNETITELEKRGITVLLKGIRPEHRRALDSAGAIGRLASEHHVFETLDAAITHARLHVERNRSSV
jgi:sulfate permease, SulP family